MTTAPERPRTRAPARKPRIQSVAALEAPPDDRPKSYCGTCAGHRAIWCDGCCGFEGCALCRWTFKRPCPTCVGGDAERIRW